MKYNFLIVILKFRKQYLVEEIQMQVSSLRQSLINNIHHFVQIYSNIIFTCIYVLTEGLIQF